MTLIDALKGLLSEWDRNSISVFELPSRLEWIIAEHERSKNGLDEPAKGALALALANDREAFSGYAAKDWQPLPKGPQQ